MKTSPGNRARPKQTFRWARSPNRQFPITAVAEAAFALADGAVSDPVNGRFSTVLLKATIVGKSTARPLDDMRDELMAAVRVVKARGQLLDLHDKFEDARASRRITGRSRQ